MSEELFKGVDFSKLNQRAKSVSSGGKSLPTLEGTYNCQCTGFKQAQYESGNSGVELTMKIYSIVEITDDRMGTEGIDEDSVTRLVGRELTWRFIISNKTQFQFDNLLQFAFSSGIDLDNCTNHYELFDRIAKGVKGVKARLFVRKQKTDNPKYKNSINIFLEEVLVLSPKATLTKEEIEAGGDESAQAREKPTAKPGKKADPVPDEPEESDYADVDDDDDDLFG